MDPRRQQLAQLERAPDAAVLLAARTALPSDLPFAQACCALLWTRHERSIEALLRARAWDLAADAMSDVQYRFTRWVYGSTPLATDSLRGVAMAMASAALMDAMRTASRHDGVPLDDSVVVTLTDPFELLGDDGAVDALLAPLTPRDRRIIEAYLAEVPDQQLAAELEISIGALHVARHRAWKRLRSGLEAEP